MHTLLWGRVQEANLTFRGDIPGRNWLAPGWVWERASLFSVCFCSLSHFALPVFAAYLIIIFKCKEPIVAGGGVPEAPLLKSHVYDGGVGIRGRAGGQQMQNCHIS